ncbi:hypothetical protein VNN28_01590 [Lactococcus formosensis]|uniref:hypothetical protein n=1 Tax=Lactococcus formosensis TaxID=1281486 RepID=UPI0030CC8BC8
MNKNNQTYIFSALIFLGASFLIIVSEESVFTNLDSLLGLLLIIQSSFILNYIGIFIFQNVAFMERTAELSYYKKQLPKIQTLSYLMALSFFTVALSMDLTVALSMDLTVVLTTVFLIVTNAVIRAYFASARILKLMEVERQIKDYLFEGILGFAFILLTTCFNRYTVAFFSMLLLSRTFWNFKRIVDHDSSK